MLSLFPSNFEIFIYLILFDKLKEFQVLKQCANKQRRKW